MTTPPVPPYGSPDEPSDPYAAPRPHQPPLTPYNPPSADAPAPPPVYGAPPAYGAPASPYGPGAPAPYGSPYPAPGYPGAYGSPYTPPPRTNGLAVASMVVSIASLLLCAGFPGIVGLVLGIVALNQVMRDGTRGRGFAITGIVVGAVCTAFAMLIVLAATMSDS